MYPELLFQYIFLTITWLVGWLYWGFTSIQWYFGHIATWKQEITNIWSGESNPGPLNPQAKSLTTRPPPLPTLNWDMHITGSGTLTGNCYCRWWIPTPRHARALWWSFPWSMKMVRWPGADPVLHALLLSHFTGSYILLVVRVCF